MGFFLEFFRKKKTAVIRTQNAAEQNENIIRLLSLRGFMKDILQAERYIAGSEYKDEIPRY